MLTVTTPMTQAAVKLVHDQGLPIVFAPVTDPVSAGIVPDWAHGSARFVGASDLQYMPAVLEFAGKLLGPVKSVGLLYNPGESNDVSTMKALEAAAQAAGMTLRAVSVDTVADIPQRVQALKGVDFIYASPSNLLMPALPSIAANADRLGIPIISASPPGALDGTVLAAMSVSWPRVGYQAGLLAAQILAGAKPAALTNYRPGPGDSMPVVSGKKLKATGRTLPAALADCNCVAD